MKKFLLTVALAVCSIINANATTIDDFQVLSNKGPTANSVCKQHGGDPIPVNDEILKTVLDYFNINITYTVITSRINPEFFSELREYLLNQ